MLSKVMENRMDDYLVTIVVVTYNHEDYIIKALESVMIQKTSFAFNIVVADDCSKDSTVRICKEMEKRYQNIKVIDRKKNLGLVHNLFDVLNNYCTGEFVAIMAGDDFWNDENKLQSQVDYLQLHRDCSCVHTGYYREYVDTEKKEMRGKWESPLLDNYGKKMAKEVLKENFSSFPVASSIMFRNQVLKTYIDFIRVATEDTFARGEGMILFPIFALSGKFAFLEDPMVTYRVFPSSASHFTDEKAKEKFSLYYLFQKLNTIKLLHLGVVIKLYFNIKVIKNFLLYSRRSTKHELRNYLNQYRKSPTYNLYPCVSLFIKIGLLFRNNNTKS